MANKKRSLIKGSINRSKLRIKYFLLIFGAALIFTTSITVLFSYRELEAEKELFQANEINAIEIKNKTISNKFGEIISDLMYLSRNENFKQLVNNASDNDLDRLTSDWQLFMEEKGIYDQIRYLNIDGMEIARVNYNNGEPETIPVDQLQNKAERYYFRDTLKLDEGQVFISPFDLNIEKGEIESPLKPMIRFGVPVFGDNSDKKGIFIVNYLGPISLKNLRRLMSIVP